MRTLYLLALVSVLCCVAASLAHSAQVKLIVSGRYWMADQSNSSAPVIAANATSIFVLRKGILAKYDAKTHEQQGVLPLFGPLAEMPKDFLFDDMQAENDFVSERIKRLAPATMTVTDTEVQVLIGDRYFRVDPVTLKQVSAALISTDAIPLTRPDDYLLPGSDNPMISHGAVSYRVILPRWPNQYDPIHLLAFDQVTGKVLATATLPTAMQEMMKWEQVPQDQQFRDIYQLLQNPPITLMCTDDSVYVLRLGVLAKFDAKTLAPQQTLPLYDAPAKLADPDKATLEEKLAVNNDHAKRYLTGMLTPAGQYLNVLVGDDFFRVDTTAMTIKTKGQVVKTEVDDLHDRLDYLALHSTPAVTFRGDMLYLVNDKRLLKVDMVKGDVIGKDLPELLVRDLLPTVPKVTLLEGRPTHLIGLLQRHTGEQGEYWTVCDETNGEVKLTGDKLTELLEKIKTPDFSNVMAIGTYKQVEKTGCVDVQILNVFPANLRGVLQKQQQDGHDCWTVKTASGIEYTVIGDDPAFLKQLPKLTGKKVVINGTFTADKQDTPLLGKAYLKMTSIQRDRVLNPQVLPATLAGATEGIVVTRAGALAVFDPVTLAVKASTDLFPPMPVAGDTNQQEFWKERARRIAAPCLSTTGKSIFAAIGTELFSTGFDLKDIKSASFTTPANTRFTTTLSGTVYCLATPEMLTVVNQRDVTKQFAIKLPPEMSKQFFPSIQELYGVNKK